MEDDELGTCLFMGTWKSALWRLLGKCIFVIRNYFAYSDSELLESLATDVHNTKVDIQLTRNQQITVSSNLRVVSSKKMEC